MIVQGIHDANQVRKSRRKLGNRKYLEPRFNQIEKDVHSLTLLPWLSLVKISFLFPTLIIGAIPISAILKFFLPVLEYFALGVR